ncbi:uncharacterized protein G2W53_043876 [Senna tora]|uniref:Uncharacterized protein n=1 Tax=Senna tora TaxID=362788 RepID=A0A834SLX5_9FABA|nr:uncharacterized protein G2W53_043876 [Senna tora]
MGKLKVGRHLGEEDEVLIGLEKSSFHFILSSIKLNEGPHSVIAIKNLKSFVAITTLHFHVHGGIQYLSFILYASQYCPYSLQFIGTNAFPFTSS